MVYNSSGECGAGITRVKKWHDKGVDLLLQFGEPHPCKNAFGRGFTKIMNNFTYNAMSFQAILMHSVHVWCLLQLILSHVYLIVWLNYVLNEHIATMTH